MIVLTCINDPEHEGYKLLAESCRHYKLNLKTLVHSSGWGSHRIKDVHVRKFLSSLDPNEIVFFTDGYDTLFVAGEKEILKKYYANGKSVLFSTETNCYPHEPFKELYGTGMTKFQYLNSGGYLGPAAELLDLHIQLESMATKRDPTEEEDIYHGSNQYLWTKIYLSNKNRIGLDYQCEIFQTFVNKLSFDAGEDRDVDTLLLEEINTVLSDFYILNKRLHNSITNTTPSHLHFNGVLFKNLPRSNILKEVMP